MTTSYERLNEAKDHLKEKRYQEAVELLHDPLEDETIQQEGFYYLGLALVNLGRNDEAMKHLKTVTESHLMYQFRGHAEMLLGYLHVGKQEYDSAIIYFEKILLEDPDCLQASTALGHCYTMLGQHDEAVKTYRQAIARDPHSSAAHHGLGYALCLMGGDLDEALYQCQEGVRLDPHSSAARDSLGWVLFHHGDYEEAEAQLRMALELDPHNRTIVEHLREARTAQERRRANTPVREYPINESNDFMEVN